MKKIKTQLISVILALVIVLSLSLGTLGCVLNYSTATAVLEQIMVETAELGAATVASEVKRMQAAALRTGTEPLLANADTSVETRRRIIEEQAKHYGFTRGNLLKANGDSYFDGNNYAERDYFKASIKGDAFISDPTVSKVTGKVSFLVSAPLWKDGIQGSTVIGVIYFVPDENFLNEIVANIRPSQNGYGYIINRIGTSVADRDTSLVGVENSINEAKSDPSLKPMADIESKMIQGEVGYDACLFQGEKWVQGHAPIANTAGWSLGILAPENDFLSNFYLSLYFTIGLTLFFILAGAVVAVLYANRLTASLRYCTRRIEQLALGDLNTPINPSTRKDELGILQNSTKKLVDNLQDVVRDMSRLLTEIAKRNLDVDAQATYEGDFKPLEVSANEITESLNQAMGQILQVANQVKSGSEQVSGGAQALSQGTTEQASSVQELSATIAEISAQVSLNAQNAAKARVGAQENRTQVDTGNRQMRDMLKAMEEITAKAGQINKIVKTIDDIAFQTNILALNAAVEAARAGAAGKGFAVVADEVRNLSGKSAEAAKNTTALIEETIEAVAQGSAVAAATAKAMEAVVKGTDEISDLIDRIAHASSTQASAVGQISLGIEQISAVVQTNSATSEQSAAASEELSSQAQTMEDLVAHFKLKDLQKNRR